MASSRTVRQVKNGERLRRSHTSLPHITDSSHVLSNINLQTLDGHITEEALSTISLQEQVSTNLPPYRMPPYPYPICNEPSIPGTSMPLANSSPTISQGLQTHSNKFPIEREMIIKSADKNSKIPILHSYMKKGKGAIAPDVPPKQNTAWLHGQAPYPDTKFSVATLQLMSSSENPLHPEISSAVQTQKVLNPNISKHGRLYWGTNPKTDVCESRSSDAEYNTPKSQYQLENQRHEVKAKNKNFSKTYHAIKDIISNKFKIIKENDNKQEDDLNNTVEEVKNNFLLETTDIENGISNMKVQDTYNQNLVQKHFLEQNIFKSQINAQQYQSHVVVERNNHAMQNIPPEVLMYAEDTFGSTPVIHNQTGYADLNYIGAQQLRISDNMTCRRDDKYKYYGNIESFQGRRTVSQPHLINSNNVIIADNLPQPQAIKLNRDSQLNSSEIRNHDDDDNNHDYRGSLNICSPEISSNDYGRRNCTQEISTYDSKEDLIVDKELQEFVRKKLDCEIGNTPVVYNIESKATEKLISVKKNQSGSVLNSDYAKVDNASCKAEYIRGNAAYSIETRLVTHGKSGLQSYPSPDFQHTTIRQDGLEWIDISENDLKNDIITKNPQIADNLTNSIISESISSISPPLPPLSPGEQSSSSVYNGNSIRHNQDSIFSAQNDIAQCYENSNISDSIQTEVFSKYYASRNQKHQRNTKVMENSILITKQMQNFGLDTTDITSSTTKSMDLESILDVHTESDADFRSYDAQTIRKQLEALEGMYGEVMKLLGIKRNKIRYQPSDPRNSKRRYCSISSLQTSSVSSRPIKDKRRSHEVKKTVRDLKGISKRFQRLESHVVTLARSVAHLSSEMRTQHLMIQEMENIRIEISTLRTQTNMLNIRLQATSRSNLKQLPSLANPARVKKLTTFFGDEPPLLRLFLRNMGYEKYASLFEKECIGMIELPYLSEERLQKLGIPLGPRLRIMEESHISVHTDNTLCIV